MDKVSIVLVVYYGGKTFFINSVNIDNFKDFICSILIISTFLYTIYLYYYGYCYNKYCFHEDKKVANLYHSLLHIVSSIGHNLIVISSKGPET